MKASVLCESRSIPLVRTLRAFAACPPRLRALPLRHLEYFYDHVRIESLLFDGALAPRAGAIYPDLSRPGLGVELKYAGCEALRGRRYEGMPGVPARFPPRRTDNGRAPEFDRPRSSITTACRL